MKQLAAHAITVAATLGVLAAGTVAFVYSGRYDIGADEHHSRLVFAALQTLRDRSIRLRAQALTVPNLDDPQLILKGAGQYAAMCTGCHLAPGVDDSELRAGMYPQPPNLSKARVDPRRAFWVIKHGIKMSAMPACGMAGHDDPTIWSMVAFLEQLPGMTPAEYRAIVAKAPPDEDMDEGGGQHGQDDAAPARGAPGMKGMDMPGQGVVAPPPAATGSADAKPAGDGHTHR